MHKKSEDIISEGFHETTIALYAWKKGFSLLIEHNELLLERTT